VPACTSRLILIALAALAPCHATAQPPQSPPRWPTPQDIDRTLKATPFPGSERIASQPTPQVPRIDAKPAGIDIEPLTHGKLHLPAVGAKAAPLRIFVTLDMPRASLDLLTDQAARTGAVLVLRGLKSQSMRETLRAVGDLIGNRKVAWVIDPEAFTRYGVNKAPTFVLALTDPRSPAAQHGCSTGCATSATFVSVAGDVSLDYALEAMLRGRPDAAPVAEPLLKRLRAS
jgi:conjugal transfer pilus assembly protein TrbC